MSLSASTESMPLPLANPTTVPELQMQREVAGVETQESYQMETDSLSEASSTSIEQEHEEEAEGNEVAASPHEEQDEESSIDDRDLPDDVIHSVTLRKNNNELMTFTLRTGDNGQRIVDISGATPLTLSAESFESIVEDLFYDVNQEASRKEWSTKQLQVWEDQRAQEFELFVTFTKIFGSFFLFLLILVAIARVL
jgi:hypothetical protein